MSFQCVGTAALGCTISFLPILGTKVNRYDDEQYVGKNLHKIRTDSIQKDVYNLSNYLSDEQLKELKGTSSLIETLAKARGLM
jgi:hypothetical protein